MKNISWNKELANFSALPNADAPAFLFTRIEQKIATRKASTFTPAISWAMTSALIMWFAIQLYIIAPKLTPTSKANWVESYQLLPDNQLYP